MARNLKASKRNDSTYNRKFFLRVLLSFFLLEFAFLLIFSILYSINSSRRISEHQQLESSLALEKLIQDVDHVFRNYKDTYLYLSHVPDINFLLFSREKTNYLNISRGDIVLSQAWNLAPYLHSVFLYNKEIDLVLWSGNLNIDRNKLMHGDLKKINTLNAWNFVNSHLLDQLGKPISQTLSIVFTNDEIIGSQSESGIVLTLHSEDIEKKLLSQIPGVTFLTDEDGNIHFKGGQDFPLPEKKNLDNLIAGALASPGTHATTDYIVNSIRSDSTGFYLVNFVDPHLNQDKIFGTQARIVIFSVLSLLMSFLIAFLIAKRLYSPIQKMTNLLINSPYRDGNARAGEFALITKSYNDVINQIKKLEIKHQGQNVLLREVFLRKILKTGVVSEQDMRQFKLNDFAISFPDVIPLCMKISDFNSIEDNKRLASINTVKIIIAEYMSRDYSTEVVNLYEGEIGILIKKYGSAENDDRNLKSILKKIMRIINDSLDHSVIVAIGAPAESLEAILHCYTAAQELAKYRFQLGSDIIIDDSILEAMESYSIDYPLELESQLLKSIRRCDEEQFTEVLGEIINLLKQCSYSRSVTMLLQLISECIKAMNFSAQEDRNHYFIDMAEFNSIFNTTETIDQAGDWLIDTFLKYKSVLKKVQSLKTNKYYDLVEEVRDYIDENYNDPNMNAESIAYKAGYSSYYFSRIFKDIAGTNIIDYVRQHRIRRAKELLSDNRYKVREISFLVGFSNTSHFYATFKKDVGLTPLEYRSYIEDSTRDESVH